MNRKTLYMAVVALQFLAVAGIVGFKYSVVLKGRTVVLDTVPIDPRDLLRGDYVRLRFRITAIDPRSMDSDGTAFEPGDDAYVALSEGKPAWRATGVYHELPELGEGRAVIKGKVTGVSPNRIEVDYGIDSYYVPEGTGRDVERLNLWEVYLDREGHPVLKGPLKAK